MASWLVHSYLDEMVQGQALARDIVLYSWNRHFTLSASLHPGVQMVTGKLNASHPGGSRNTPSRFNSCFRNWDKL